MANSNAPWYWHLHHGILAEQVDGSLIERIKYILDAKDENERLTRLMLIHPVKMDYETEGAIDNLNDTRSLYENYGSDGGHYNDQLVSDLRQLYYTARERFVAHFEEIHKEQCPQCPWDGKTIFPYVNGEPTNSLPDTWHGWTWPEEAREYVNPTIVVTPTVYETVDTISDSDMEWYCDGSITHYTGDSDGYCNNLNVANNYACTRSTGHTGEHRACGASTHNLNHWPHL